jgi:uncharacterized metal-binding protein
MTEEHPGNNKNVLLFPCSGGSNCGLITHEVAVSLDILGLGHLFCLAGIGAQIDGVVEYARTAKKIVAIDGCEAACARKTIENAGLRVTDWICVSEEGINIKHQLILDQEEIELITNRVKQRLTHIN